MSESEPSPEVPPAKSANRRRVLVLLAVIAGFAIYIAWSIGTYDPYYVAAVVHPNLLYLKSDEGVELISVDCPPVQDVKVGKPATDFVIGNVLHRRIRIESGEQPKNEAGRTLGYVFYKDASGKERFLNEDLLRRGYGRLKLAFPNLKYRKELEAAEAEANEKQLGIWAPDYPDGKK